MKLSKLNPTKANGPHGIPSCLLKEDANLFSDPIKQYWTLPTEKAIFRSLGSLEILFLYQNRNLCKKKKNVNKDLRAIWLTSILSKVAKDFVVESFVKPAVVTMILKQPVWNDYEMLNNLHLNRYAGHMEYTNLTETALERIVLFDYKKAWFDRSLHSRQKRSPLIYRTALSSESFTF